ncbi:MAG: histidine kinase [Acidobacteriota bacterium]|nr:MAG: histidine kinase [Acidobacteriota bacterium]
MNFVRKAVSFMTWKVLSVPIFFKIMGIGALVALLFGSVMLVQTRRTLAESLTRMLEQNAIFTGRTIAANLEEHMVPDDTSGLDERLSRLLESYPELRYIVVRDREGKTVGHSFADTIPSELQPLEHHLTIDAVRIIQTKTETIVETRAPILEGKAGSVQLGVSHRVVADELDALTAILRALLLSASVGGALALGLTRILTRPVHDLVEAADGIRAGHLESRAEIYSGDEIGELAVAFNHMAETLESYRREVQEKDELRISLIEKIIQTQENERKTLSRELHDQFGQSLLALHLRVESNVDQGRLDPDLGGEIQQKISELVDDIHRLVQGIRPPVLDDYGLDVALRGMVSEALNAEGLSIDYHYSGPEGQGRLPGRVEVTLYRIAQEALTNVLRHAHASRASVIVLQKTEDVMLLVEDDGSGFDAGNFKNNEHGRLGILGMKERASLLGGSCTVESDTDRGTTIRVRIPLVKA